MNRCFRCCLVGEEQQRPQAPDGEGRQDGLRQKPGPLGRRSLLLGHEEEEPRVGSLQVII